MDLGTTGFNQQVTEIPALVQLLFISTQLLGPLLQSWNMAESFFNRGRREKELDAYDFIVVGAGSGGVVVANRLSDKYNVLLIEAGGTPNRLTEMPILAFSLHGLDAVDWKWRTVPQKSACFGLKDKVAFWPGGKGLGGSNNINAMLYLRGIVQEFDNIANRTDNEEWKMENMLQFYKELEDYHGYYDSEDHGKGGLLSIEKSDLRRLTHHYLEAGRELNFAIKDANSQSPTTDGFSPMDLYQKNGRRWTAYKAYIKNIEKRESLLVKKYATVTKILLDNKNRATGVEYYQNGRYRLALVKKEVILAAGAIQSPKLLMLSGIGPRQHLEAMKIPVRVDLPVGENLQDSYGAIIGPFLTNSGSSFLAERELTFRSLVEWQSLGTGPVQSSRIEASNYLTTSYATSGNPDITTYLYTDSMDSNFDPLMSTAFNINDNILNEYFRKAKWLDSFMQFVTLNSPSGVGELRLRDKDPFSRPIIDPKYLEHPQDVKVLVEGIKFAMDLVEGTQSFKELNGTLMSGSIPGCESHTYRSDAYWECLVRHMTLTSYKYAWTVPMGKDRSNSPEAVVDSTLRVLETTGVRVIDSSTLPTALVSHSSVQAIAELASSFILKEWQDSLN